MLSVITDWRCLPSIHLLRVAEKYCCEQKYYHGRDDGEWAKAVNHRSGVVPMTSEKCPWLSSTAIPRTNTCRRNEGVMVPYELKNVSSTACRLHGVYKRREFVTQSPPPSVVVPRVRNAGRALPAGAASSQGWLFYAIADERTGLNRCFIFKCAAEGDSCVFPSLVTYHSSSCCNANGW